MFAIDWDRQQVTCPQGAASLPWSAARPGGRDGFTVVPRRRLPGLPGPRQVHHLSPPPAAVPAPPRNPRGRHRPAGQPDRPGWKDRYAIRASVEGTIRQATAVTGIRTARYRGLPKTSLEHAAAATAINLIRLDAWQTSKPLGRTRTTCLQRLTLPPPPKPQ